MKIIIITQEDHFVIPKNINKIVRLDDINVQLIVSLNSKGTLVNKKTFFAKGFGCVQAAKMGFKLIANKLLNKIDRLTDWRLLSRKKSVQAVACCNDIPFITIDNPNNESFLSRLQEIAPDLIVSFSAPCVFHPPLLSIPKNGCINLHCSYLPNYAGLLPSFWALYHDEKETGASVHYMDDRIDNGGILAQAKVAIAPGTTMFELIKKTKAAGGELVCKVIKAIKENTAKAQPNIADEDAYFSWPTVEQMKKFRRRGGRFV